VQPEKFKLQPYFDEETEAVKGIPPTPIEQVPETNASAPLDFQGTSREGVVPPEAGLESSPTRMMPPPSTAFASGLATPMDVGTDVPLSLEADE
jgi:hypothetical protein